MQRNNPFDHQSIGSKNAKAAHRARSSKTRPAPKIVVGSAPPPVPHVCANVTGGSRCDTCFGPVRLRLLEETSAKRKQYPITTGLLDYFPDACAAVAEVSYLGNEKHNPGEPMHWARGKSMDHADCVGRHLVERGGFDVIVINGTEHRLRHSAALAWRAFALLQEELERDYGLAAPRGAAA